MKRSELLLLTINISTETNISFLNNLIKNKPKGLIVGSPATDAQIKALMYKLKLALGQKYISFLKLVGYLSFNSFEIYGITDNNNSIPSCIHATLNRRKYDTLFSSKLIIIGAVGNGDEYAIDNRDNVFLCKMGKTINLNMKFDEFIEEEINKQFV